MGWSCACLRDSKLKVAPFQMVNWPIWLPVKHQRPSGAHYQGRHRSESAKSGISHEGDEALSSVGGGSRRLTLATLIGLRSLFMEPCTKTSQMDATGFDVNAPGGKSYRCAVREGRRRQVGEEIRGDWIETVAHLAHVGSTGVDDGWLWQSGAKFT